MDFSLTDEQEAIRELAARFAQGRLLPHCRSREQAGRVEPALRNGLDLQIGEGTA